MWDLYRNTENNINFHYRLNSVKVNDQIFNQKKLMNKLQKTLLLAHFWSIFPISGAPRQMEGWRDPIS